jgi:hypothetical protein
MRLAVFKPANKKRKEALLPKLFGESQSLLERMLFEKERMELWKPGGAAKRPHSKAGWNRPSLAKQWRPNPAEVRCISRNERA